MRSAPYTVKLIFFVSLEGDHHIRVALLFVVLANKNPYCADRQVRSLLTCQVVNSLKFSVTAVVNRSFSNLSSPFEAGNFRSG